MEPVLDATQTTNTLSLGHIALHYAKPEDGPAAARLLSLIGLVETQDLLLPNGTHFYRFVVDGRHYGRGDGIIYLSAVPEAQQKLIDAMRSALGVGTEDEHPSVGGMRDALLSDPEYSFHVGLLADSLEAVEKLVLDLRERADSDPDLKGRLNITLNRPMPGDAEVDARLDASPVFGGVTRHAYGRNGIQVFIETDLLVSGTLGESTVIEIDYVFPGSVNHVLSVVELG